MRTATAMAPRVELSDAAQAWLEVEAHQITLAPMFDGRLWQASVERVVKPRKFGRDEMEVISAFASVSIDAVRALVRKLDE